MTTPITIHLTDDEIEEVRKTWGSLTPINAHPSNVIMAKLYAALPEPPRPLEPGDLVDVLVSPGGWSHAGRMFVGCLDGRAFYWNPTRGVPGTRALDRIRHHQEGVA